MTADCGPGHVGTDYGRKLSAGEGPAPLGVGLITRPILRPGVAAATGGDNVPYVATTTLIKGARATRSTIFLKLLMAGSGIVFIGFTLLHMYGNLKAFSGEEKFNEYAHHLRELGEPMLPYEGALWLIRAALLASLIIHVYAAVVLWRRAKKARTIQYQVKKHTGAIPASRMMRWGGLTLLVFIIWHLLNFTVGKVNVKNPGETENPYRLLVDSFSTPWLTVIYLIAMAMLGAHLHHGIWSATQTLGLTGSVRTRVLAKRSAFGLAVLISGGFSLVPLFVLFDVITY